MCVCVSLREGESKDAPPPLPPPLLSSTHTPTGKCPVHGVDSVATIPAAVISYLAIGALKPDLTITAGTAGGLPGQGRRHR